ncbi:hypothetical protein JOB18_038034 [Solea senegalensis]|uniref:Uncharacterized protein n=1 Tax=Solea senegalensis TaxID=28829 RepID=A0AAV6S0W9_SOLSE|nr:hypothetical protein JOB18_038034 [Solea senegalensis]
MNEALKGTAVDKHPLSSWLRFEGPRYNIAVIAPPAPEWRLDGVTQPSSVHGRVTKANTEQRTSTRCVRRDHNYILDRPTTAEQTGSIMFNLLSLYEIITGNMLPKCCLFTHIEGFSGFRLLEPTVHQQHYPLGVKSSFVFWLISTKFKGNTLHMASYATYFISFAGLWVTVSENSCLLQRVTKSALWDYEARQPDPDMLWKFLKERLTLPGFSLHPGCVTRGRVDETLRGEEREPLLEKLDAKISRARSRSNENIRIRKPQL